MGTNNIANDIEEFSLFETRTTEEIRLIKEIILQQQQKERLGHVTFYAPPFDKQDATYKKKHTKLKELLKIDFENGPANYEKGSATAATSYYNKLNEGTGIEMEGVHPTLKGTTQLFEVMSSNQVDIGCKGVIHKQKFLVTGRTIYSDVQDAFRYGCLRCTNIWDIQSGYCGECVDRLYNVVNNIPKDKRSRDEEQDEFDNMNGKKLDMSKSPIYSYANAVNATVLLGNDLNLSSDGDSSRNDDES